MTDKENRLKLLKNEVVHCETFMLAAQVCELADKLGLKWDSETRFRSTINYNAYSENTCYLLHKAEYCSEMWYRENGKTIITAVEWLNRHDIFVYGQVVQVPSDYSTRIYIAPHTCVASCHRHEFFAGESFQTRRWSTIESPFPAWPPEPVKRTITLEGVEIEISQEQHDAIKASLGES